MARSPPYTNPSIVAVVCLFFTVVLSRPVRAHVRYVAEDSGDPISLITLLGLVLGEPINIVLMAGGTVFVIASLVGYLRFRPAYWDIVVARESLKQYVDLVPWLLRLSVGLPLIGAGFEGYFFTPLVPAPTRLFNVTIGFLLLFGLATRLAATIGLVTYLVGVFFAPELLLAAEFVGGFLAIILLGGGRPSADQVLQHIAEAERTRIQPVDVIRTISVSLNRHLQSLGEFAPTVLRVGLGGTFIYLGLHEKLLNAGHAAVVVDQYNLTAVIPVDPWMWVFGVGMTEVILGFALIVGFFTRGVALIAFGMFTLTMFALPDDPILAHITYFGLTSALLITGSGRISLDNWIAKQYPESKSTTQPG